MAIERAFVLVTGPAGAGKTTLIERFLESNRSKILIVARTERDDRLNKVQETFAAEDPELGRYLEAGAVRAVRYRFPEASRSSDDFFCGRFMETYSEGVLIEGENPLDYRLDLRVYVAPPLPEGEPLLRRVPVDREAERAAGLDRLQEKLWHAWERAGSPIRSELADFFLQEALAERRSRTPAKGSPDREERWTVADSHQGIEQGQVVVLNLRSPDQRAHAEATLAEIDRLRKDREVFDDVIGWAGKRTRIMAGAADLSDPKDPGLRRILTRIKRPFARRS